MRRQLLSSGEDALFTILSWRDGKTAFQADIDPKERTILNSTEQVLLNWSHRKQEWEKIRKVIPSNNAVFRPALQKNPGDRVITGDQWNVLALANGMRTISEIAGVLGWDEFKSIENHLPVRHSRINGKSRRSGSPGEEMGRTGFF